MSSKQTEPLSRGSIPIVLAELTSVLNHAKEDGLIAVNPAGRLGQAVQAGANR